MKPILIAYATTYGSTREVADAMAATLASEGYDAVVSAAREVDSLDTYAAVVLGGAIYFFRWHKHARRFLAKHQSMLANMPVAVFGMGPFEDKSQDFAASRGHLDRSLAKHSWLTPRAIGIFGGCFDPEGLKFPHKNPAMKQMPASDIRDWDTIRTWAADLPEALGLEHEEAVA